MEARFSELSLSKLTLTLKGTDLQKRTEAALLEEMEKFSSFPQDSFPCLLCVPEQGRLAPYEKTTVAVRFSPLSNR